MYQMPLSNASPSERMLSLDLQPPKVQKPLLCPVDCEAVCRSLKPMLMVTFVVVS